MREKRLKEFIEELFMNLESDLVSTEHYKQKYQEILKEKQEDINPISDIKVLISFLMKRPLTYEEFHMFQTIVEKYKD